MGQKHQTAVARLLYKEQNHKFQPLDKILYHYNPHKNTA